MAWSSGLLEASVPVLSPRGRQASKGGGPAPGGRRATCRRLLGLGAAPGGTRSQLLQDLPVWRDACLNE